MMRFLRFTVLALALVLLTSGAALAYLLQDANRLKPQIQTLIETQTGVPVRIDGDLDWRLWPPVSLSATEVSADYQGKAWEAGSLSLDLDALRMLRDPGQWRVQGLRVADVTMQEQGSVLAIRHAHLADLAPRSRAPVAATLSYTPAGGEAFPVNLAGNLQVDPETLNLALSDTRIETPEAEGICNLDATPVADPAPAPPAGEDDLIPLAMLLGYRFDGECRLDWVQMAEQRFENVSVTVDNDAGAGKVTLLAPQFFGGRGQMDVAIDARANPMRWVVTPDLDKVDSRALLTWLDQNLQWAAPLAYGGTLTFEGNSADAMLASLSGRTHFDGGQGRMDITEVKSQLLTLAGRFNESERIAGWPDVWEYQRFVGDWQIERQHHRLNFALDNLTGIAEGDYDPLKDHMDMNVELTFGDDPALPVFDLNPLLYDLPIPIQCRGSLAEPTCQLDPQAAQRIVAQALASDSDDGLKAKLERKIDEDVPEQYRDAARSLLEALSGSLKPPAEEER